MMRSLYSGVAGLQNMQTKLDVIGNNIANVSTTGYKKSRVLFQDTLYQVISGASTGSDSAGGTNPKAVGLGMTVSSIDVIHTGASTSTTNNPTDMAVDGSGYFVVKDGDLTYYTRNGSFNFDNYGNLVNPSGCMVQGWLADDENNIDTTASVENINISDYYTKAAKTTELVELTGNLDSNTEVSTFTDITDANEFADEENTITYSVDVYDTMGNAVTLYLRFYKTEIDTVNSVTSWACDISTDPEFENSTDYDHTDGDDFEAIDLSAGGSSAEVLSASDILRAYGIEYDSSGNILNEDNAAFTITIDRSAEGADDIVFTLDMANMSQYNADSKLSSYTQDGYPTGTLSSYSIGSDGVITGVYDNGESLAIAQVALATFKNPAGLNQVGSSLFQVSNNSGTANISAPGQDGKGAIVAGCLEMSNVDLSTELTDMIVTQRAYQANSRVITTSDEMLEELVNLKR